MDINIFEVYEGRYLFFTDDINDIIFDYETSDIDVIYDLEQIILSLPRKSENTIATEDIYVAFDNYFKKRGDNT